MGQLSMFTCPVCDTRNEVKSWKEDVGGAPTAVETLHECRACGYTRHDSYGEFKAVVGKRTWSWSYRTSADEEDDIQDQIEIAIKGERKARPEVLASANGGDPSRRPEPEDRAVSEHTKGPWYVGTMNDALFVIDKPPRPSTDDVNPNQDVQVIAKVCPVEGDVRTEAESARANLIAAAPDLLAVVEAYREWETHAMADSDVKLPMRCWQPLLDLKKKRDAALAKAKGLPR